MSSDLISRLVGLGALMTVELSIIPNDASEICFLAAQEIADLKAQLAEAQDAAHRIADELAEADRTLVEVSRELRS
ncbi:hypothetical protein [Petrachloros mirabilis]